MYRNMIAGILMMAAVLLKAAVVFAVDGDVDYSAPYLWVDPNTGQISTINPGPQPKVHAETAGSSRSRPADKKPSTEDSVETSSDAGGTGEN